MTPSNGRRFGRIAILLALLGGLAFAAHRMPRGPGALDVDRIGARWARLLDAAGSASGPTTTPDAAGSRGAYGLAPAHFIPGTIGQIAVGDVTGDGRDDLVHLAFADEYKPLILHVSVQTAGGGIAPPRSFNLPGNPADPTRYAISALVLADLNEDGRKDIILAPYLGGGLVWLLSQPGGTFDWREDRWNTQQPTNGQMLVTDADKDGNLDITLHVANHDAPRFPRFVTYHGDGTGKFPRHSFIDSGEAGTAIAYGDVNGDGNPDLVSIGNGIQVRLHDAQTGFLPAYRLYLGALEWYEQVVIGDLNNDGRSDVGVTNLLASPRNRLLAFYQSPGGVLSGVPVGTFIGTSDPTSVSSLTLHDLNKDGLTDVVYHTTRLGLMHMLGGDARLDEATPLGAYYGEHFEVGDLNTDGIPDVVLGMGYDGLLVQHGTLAPYAGSGTVPGAPAIATASVDPQSLYNLDADLATVDVVVSPPASDGGLPILGYEVRSIPEGAIDVSRGSTSLNHRVTVLDNDTEYRFYAVARNAAGAGPASAVSAPVYVRDVPTVRISEYGGGTEEEGFAKIGIELSYPALKGGATVSFSTSDDSAIAGVDYVATSGQVHFAHGQQFADAVVPLLDDAVPEVERFQITVTGATGAKLMDVHWRSRTAYIADGDSPPPPAWLTVAHAHAKEGDAGTTQMLLRAWLDRALPHPVSFQFHTNAGTIPVQRLATPGVDYLAVSADFVIPAGQTAIDIPVTILGDTVIEQSEEFGFTATNVVGAMAAPTVWGMEPRGAILDDDLPTIRFDDVLVSEGHQGTRGVRVVATTSVPVQYETTFEAATEQGACGSVAGVDYLPRVVSPLRIPPGGSSVAFDVQVVGDAIAEPDECFLVSFRNLQGAKLAGPGSATVLIQNDDGINQLSVSDVRVVEGQGTPTARFRVQLSSPATAPVYFDPATVVGTALPGADYTAVDFGRRMIPVGESAVDLAVPIADDDAPEADETFALHIGNVVGATVADGDALATIVDFDAPTLRIDDLAVVEGTDSDKTVYFRITLSEPLAFPMTFTAASDMRGPTYWYDYRATYTTMVIDAGRTEVWYPVTILGDASAEGDETFGIEIFDANYATVVKGRAIGTILDDDGPPASTSAADSSRAAVPPRPVGRLGSRGDRAAADAGRSE